MQRRDRALEEIAKKLASEITAVLLAPPSPITANNAVLNYANFFWLGIAMHAALTKLGVMPPISELLNEERSLEHSRLEAAIHKQILAKAHETSPDEFQRRVHRIRKLITTRRGLRQLHIQLVRAVIPAASPGRNRKITREQLPELAKLSEQLLPTMRTFLEVQKQAPKADVIRTLEYLRAQIPEDTFQYLSQRTSRLEREYRRLPKIGKAGTRARYLADALAGDRWGLSASYAVKMSKQARAQKKHCGKA